MQREFLLLPFQMSCEGPDMWDQTFRSAFRKRLIL